MAIGRLDRTIWESWLALPSRLTGRALDLLVVLELELEQPDHLHGRAGGPGDGHPAVPVGRVHLLHGAVGDRRAGGGPAVAGHHHAVGVADGRDRRAVARSRAGGPDGRAPTGANGRGRPAQHVGEARPRFVLGANIGRVIGSAPYRARSTTAAGEPMAARPGRPPALGVYSPPFWT